MAADVTGFVFRNIDVGVGTLSASLMSTVEVTCGWHDVRHTLGHSTRTATNIFKLSQ